VFANRFKSAIVFKLSTLFTLKTYDDLNQITKIRAVPETSEFGTNRTNRGGLAMSDAREMPEVAGRCQNDAIDPSATLVTPNIFRRIGL